MDRFRVTSNMLEIMDHALAQFGISAPMKPPGRISTLLDRAHRSGEGQRELGKYLVRAQDFSILEWIFDALTTERILSQTQFELEPTAMRQEAYASTALRYLGIISRALKQDIPSSTRYTVYLTRLKEMVMDHWTQIISWVHEIIMRAHHVYDAGTGSDMIYTLCHTINSLFSLSKGDDNYMDALLSQLASTEVPHLLLCQAEGSTGRYFYTATADTPCQILAVLRLCTGRDLPLRSMQSQLLASGERSRNAAVTSIVARAEQIVSSASERPIASTLTSMEQLVNIASSLTLEGTPCLSPKQHRRILSHLSLGLLHLTQAIEPAQDHPRLWTRIVQLLASLVVGACRLGRGRAANLVALVQGGIFACIWECALHSDSDELSADMSDLIARFYHSEVYFAALKGGHLGCVLQLNPAAQPDGSQFVLNTFRGMFGAINDAYDRRRDRAVHRCSNLWHSRNTNRIRADSHDLRERVCSRCRSVTYCSRECQQEDWNHLHRAECSILAKQHQDKKACGGWISAQTKEDQLRILDAVVNQCYPPASEVNSIEISPDAWKATRQSPITHHPDSIVSMMDFFCASEVDTASHQEVPVAFHFTDGWGREAISPWIRRLQACVDDMEQNKDTVILVDGRFSLGTSFSALVFARLHYAAEKPEGERYTILNSTFRTWDLRQ